MNPESALAEAWPVVLDEAQYARAAEAGLTGRLGSTQFDAVIMTGDRFRLAKQCEDQHGAEIAFLMPAASAGGKIDDLVAWIPESDRIATLLGKVGTLGLWTLLTARLDPPTVHESLTAWFVAEETGLFILDARLAAVELEGVTMASPDKDAALRLRAKLAPHCTRAPKIVVPRSNARRAG